MTADSEGATSVRVTWELPSGFTCISRIFITVTPEGESAVYHDVGQVTEYTIDSLTCNTTYMFGVIAVADSNGTRVPSEGGVRVLVGGMYIMQVLYPCNQVCSYKYMKFVITLLALHLLRSQEFLCISSILHISPSDLGASCI